MTQDDLDYINDLRTSVDQERPSSAMAVGELIRIIDNLRQTISEVCAARDAALRDAASLRSNVQAACNLSNMHRISWERAEAECAELRAWKAAVPVQAIGNSLWGDADISEFNTATAWYQAVALDGAA